MSVLRARLLVTLLVLAVAMTAVPLATGSPVATAATEIESFVAAPGVIRTNVAARMVEYDAVNDVIFAAADDPEGVRLLVIRRVDLQVTAERIISDTQRSVIDMAVAPDGATLFVLTEGLVTRLDATTLVQVGPTVFIEGSTTNRTLVVAPGFVDRFALVSRFLGSNGVALYDGDEIVDTTDLDMNGNAAFSNDGGTVYVAGLSVWVNRYEFDDEGGVDLAHRVRQGSGAYDDRSGKLAMYVHNDLLYLVEDYSRTVVTSRNLDTLEAVDRLTIAAGPLDHWNTSFDVSDGRFYGVDGTVYAADFDDLERSAERFNPSLGSYIVGIAALTGGDLAVLELNESDTAWMTIVSADLMTSGYGEYHALTPSRLLDTRKPTGVPAIAPLGQDKTIRVQVTGVGQVPASGVLGVVLNATVTNATRPSFISVAPSGGDRPAVSNVNFGPGQTLANAVTVVLGDGGGVDVSNRFGSVDVVMDIVGYYSDEDGDRGARYQPVTNTRLTDTRDGTGRGAPRPLGPGETMEVVLPAVVVEDLQPIAAALNITAVVGSSPSFLTVHPSDAPRPTASSLNFDTGAVRANLVISKVSDAGVVTIFNRAGTVDIVVDLFGVYIEQEDRVDQQGRFLPAEPFRAFDSRSSSPFDAPGHLPPQTALINGNTEGYTDIINLTAASTTADGFLSVIGWQDGQQLERPTTSNVNFRAGEVVANGAYATGAPNNAIVNGFGFTHVVVDVFGYLTPDTLRSIDDVWGR